MSFILVKNLNGTSDNTPPRGYNSWLNYWKAMKKLPENLNITCSCQGCRQKATVGAHVRKVIIGDNNWYIVPLCYNHNNQSSSQVFGVTCEDLIPANKNIL